MARRFDLLTAREDFIFISLTSEHERRRTPVMAMTTPAKTSAMLSFELLETVFRSIIFFPTGAISAERPRRVRHAAFRTNAW